ncbi:uncharacterized protein LOC128737876 [Sabethes cyaneus]|uniref:uncharacterized protein LOC128737876 n=1 Tax=Sabethes cyaneus TaxID=53552 RepID=UPI00237D9E00|nr:uncharacterized protein LOC128737876 [Sabethes cyaneus]
MWASSVRSSESPATKTGDGTVCTRSSASEPSNGTTPNCSSPRSKPRYSFYKDDSLTQEGGESPTIPLSQDSVNMVTGVTWAWNSPKRTTATVKQKRPRNLLRSNVNKNSDSTRIQRKKSLTGFYKFQSDLKLLQDTDRSFDGPKLEKEKLSISIPVSKIPFPNNVNKCNSCYVADKTQINVPHKGWQFDSFNDSDLNRLLVQATQKADNHSHKTVQTPTGYQLPTDEANKENNTEKRKSFVKNRTADNLDLKFELLNDSENDVFLIEASQKIESSDISTNKMLEETTSVSKRVNALTRHKSMPESTSSKVCSSRIPQRLNYSPEDSISVSASETTTYCTVGAVLPTVSNISISSMQHPIRRCTKEEIEQKRQDALKRLQERRLKQLVRQNIS